MEKKKNTNSSKKQNEKTRGGGGLYGIENLKGGKKAIWWFNRSDKDSRETHLWD